MTPEQDVFDAPVHQGAPPVQDHNSDNGNHADGQNEAQQGGQNIPAGMGQSKSSRRRRRKRKNKTIGASENGGDAQPIALQAAAQPAAAPQSAPAQNHQNGQQNNGTGKRWKKKFRDRNRPAADPNPGNNFSAGNGGGGFSQNSNNYGNGGGFKRKGGKQRKERGGFVGPMDHSYRAANGNFADAAASTIEIHGNYQQRGHHGPRHTGDSQPIDYSMGKAIPIPEGTPTKIFFFIEDLFFVAKIQETARKLGVKIAFVKNEKEAIDSLTDGEEADRPGLIVFDLNNLNAKPLTLIPKLKTKLKRSTSIIGFLSHLQGDLKAKAVEAGCDAVMPRSAFSQNLPNLLRRYGLEDEDEPNFNQ